ncbi:MAG: Tol-Pal system subunit TolQ, partial [Pseudomonadota bacterium]
MLSAIGAAVAGGAVSEVASDFSLVSLLLEAHIVVRLVLLSLVIASLWSWAVIIEKWFSLGSLRKSSQRFEDAFWSGRSDGLEGRPGQGGGDPAA